MKYFAYMAKKHGPQHKWPETFTKGTTVSKEGHFSTFSSIHWLQQKNLLHSKIKRISRTSTTQALLRIISSKP